LRERLRNFALLIESDSPYHKRPKDEASEKDASLTIATVEISKMVLSII